jgi:hypothetical protein
MSGSVLWRDKSADVALIGLAGDVPPLPPGSPMPRWGRVDGMEPIAVSAVGFPWAQERPDRGRDTEQLFGFIAPVTTVKAGLCAVTVLTAAPAGRRGGSPWAGMSGAALFAGPFLVGVVIVDPARFGTDRVVAAPIVPLLDDAELAGLLNVSAEGAARVGRGCGLQSLPRCRWRWPRRTGRRRRGWGASRRVCCSRSTASCRSQAATATLTHWRRGA